MCTAVPDDGVTRDSPRRGAGGEMSVNAACGFRIGDAYHYSGAGGVMKDHKKVEKQVSTHFLEMPLEDFIKELLKGTEGWLFITVELDSYYDTTDLVVRGWVPMTPEEISQRDARIKKDREANKRRDQKQRETRLDKFMREAKLLGYEVEKN